MNSHTKRYTGWDLKRSWAQELLCLRSLRCVTLSAWWCILVNQSGSSTKSEVQGYLWRLHYMGMTNWIFGHWWLNSISSHHPWPHIPRWEVGAECSNPLIILVVSQTTSVQPRCMQSCFSHVRLFAIPRTIAHQAPLSKVFSRQEY